MNIQPYVKLEHNFVSDGKATELLQKNIMRQKVPVNKKAGHKPDSVVSYH